MTGGAVFWSGLVEESVFAFNGAGQLVASVAVNVLVRLLQGKCRPLVMIKQRWLPLCAVVALSTRRNSALGELPAVNILMAFLTFRRRGFEVHIDQTGFLVGWLMTAHAVCAAMRTDQREGTFGVIET